MTVAENHHASGMVKAFLEHFFLWNFPAVKLLRPSPLRQDGLLARQDVQHLDLNSLKGQLARRRKIQQNRIHIAPDRQDRRDFRERIENGLCSHVASMQD